MNASDECPECHTRGPLPLAAVALLLAGMVAGIARCAANAPATEAAKDCAAIREADPAVGVYYNEPADTCHVWTGLEWRPIINGFVVDERQQQADKR